MTTAFLMASTISNPTASFTSRSFSFSNPSISVHWIRYSPLTSSWNGLKHLSISKPHYSLQIAGRMRKHKRNGVYASLFGVGAPEALVIGVVALLVFGPKGLAEVARNLGKTLRAFQPTIKELQDVSREFKSTLEREIGLDDIRGSGQDTFNSSTTKSTVNPSSDPNGSPSPSVTSSGEDDLERLMRIAEAQKQAEERLAAELKNQSQNEPPEIADNSSSDVAYSTEESLKISEEQLQAAAQQQNDISSPEQSPSTGQSQPQVGNSSSDGADGAYSSEELLKITEQQLKAAAQQQNITSSPQQSPSNAQSQ